VEVVIAIVVGVVSALIASLLFWYVQFRVFRVKLELSPTLAKYRFSDESDFRYQIKVRNRGRRDALDMKLDVRCAVTGLVRTGSTETLRLREWSAPILSAGKESRYRIQPGRMPEATRIGYRKYLPPSIREALEEDLVIDLEEFLSLGDKTELRVYLSATDALSGARSLVPRFYTSDDIQDGRFLKGSFEHTGVLEDDREDPPE
jgi:hypothetical protein